MTDRQEKLLAYLAAIRPELEGAKDKQELGARIMRCIAADAGFVAEGFANVFIEQLKRTSVGMIEGVAQGAAIGLGKFVQDLVSGVGKKR